MKKTKIICTLGPASRDENVIRKMLINGMDVARINFSHGTHEYHKETIEMFKKVRDELNYSAAVMLDMKGPEVRVKTFKNKKEMLVSGEKFILTTEECEGTKDKVTVSYSGLPKKLKKYDSILIDDGKIHLTVDEIINNDIICTIDVGGEISDRKSVNVPNVKLNIPYIGPEDERDLIFGVEQDVDFVAASFVRSKEDVIELRNFLDYYGGVNIKIISKIENIEGVNNFDEILSCSDGIMIARGDMGVEIEYEKLPGLQKKFIKKCYKAGKMVITATQMLESMIVSNTPTRAEITDVANAVFDGTSAIMLSGETAVGAHPDLVVEVMAKIAVQAEQDAFDMGIYNKDIQYETDMNDITNAICHAACTTARDVKACAIIAITKSGFTARRVSKFRPCEVIVATTPSEKTFHQLSLSWGVYPVRALYQQDANVLFDHAIACAKRFGYIKENDRVVITAGTENTTDIVKVKTVRDIK